MISAYRYEWLSESHALSEYTVFRSRTAKHLWPLTVHFSSQEAADGCTARRKDSLITGDRHLEMNRYLDSYLNFVVLLFLKVAYSETDLTEAEYNSVLISVLSP